MLMVFDHTPARERPCSYAFKGGRRGHPRAQTARDDDQSDRPPHRHDRKTIRAYLAGQRTPGVRHRADPDPFDAFIDYVTARLTEDPHLWAATLLDELVPLGFEPIGEGWRAHVSIALERTSATG